MADSFDELERAGWRSGRAAPYHHGIGAITSRPISALLEAAGAGAGVSVLDVATGPGCAAVEAARRGAVVSAVDFSPEMVALAASLHPGMDFREADAAALPFDDGVFDAVVANFLMPHVSDLPRVVAVLARVVRPGGRLALPTWTRSRGATCGSCSSRSPRESDTARRPPTRPALLPIRGR